MPAITIGQSNLVFGVTTETCGIVQSFSQAGSIEKQEVKGISGDTLAVAYFNPTTAYSLTAVATGSPTVTVGGAFTFANAISGATGAVRIDSLTVNKTNDGFMTIDISATGYPNIAS